MNNEAMYRRIALKAAATAKKEEDRAKCELPALPLPRDTVHFEFSKNGRQDRPYVHRGRREIRQKGIRRSAHPNTAVRVSERKGGCK